MIKGRILALFISLALVLGLALPAVAAAPPDNPGKGNSGLTKIVFVHYPKGVEAKGGIPGKPSGGNGDDVKKEKLWYSYDGTHWLNPSVPYVIEDVNGAGDNSFEDAVIAAFDTWEATGASIDFEGEIVMGLEYIIPSSFFETAENPYGTPNLTNEVGWMSFSDEGLSSRAIAITAIWVYTADPESIAEVDMAMNSDLGWSTDVSPDTYDVQNIATHEAGHWLKLGDLYKKPASEQTMYGYGAINETKKQSLESGDIAGILTIYPAP